MPAHFRLTPLSLGLCTLLAAGFACAAGTTLPTTSIRAQAESDPDDPRVREVSTATRTSTPARYVPQAIDTVKTANLRAGMGTQHRIVAKLKKYDVVRTLEKKQGWAKVRTSEGQQGWVSQKLLWGW